MYYLCTGQVFMNLSWLIAKWTNCSFHVCMTSYNIVIYHHLLHFNMFVLFDLCRLLRLVWMWNEELHCCRGLGSSSCEVKDRGWASFRSSLGISDSVEFSACVFGHASAGLCRCERLKSTNTHTHMLKSGILWKPCALLECLFHPPSTRTLDFWGGTCQIWLWAEFECYRLKVGSPRSRQWITNASCWRKWKTERKTEG